METKRYIFSGYFWIIPIALALAVGGCSGSNDSNGSFSALNEALGQGVTRYLVPGAVAAVRFEDGRLWTGAAGWADLESFTPMSENLYLHIGSLTKSMTATLFLTLVDDGLVGLDDTVDQWLPGMVDRGDEMTIRNLLQMRTGLAHYEDNPDFGDIFTSQPRHVFSPGELLGFCNTHVAEPGTVYDYNNINYVLVGMIIERVLGQSFDRAITERIFIPLKLGHTSFPMTPDIPSPAARGYLSENGQAVDVTTNWDPSAMWAAGSVISRLDDLLVWLDALMAGTLLSAGSHQAQFDMIPIAGSPAGTGYGMGVGQRGELIGHAGNYNGLYTASIYRVNGRDIVVMTNGQAAGGGADSIAPNITSDLLAAMD